MINFDTNNLYGKLKLLYIIQSITYYKNINELYYVNKLKIKIV
jgi:hypothetical protein